MKVFVTGATGYCGRAIVHRLLAEGHAVRALVRDPDAALAPGAEGAVADLTRPRGLDALVAGSDAVVHCAAEQRSPSRARHRLVNVAGTQAILDAAVQAGVRRVVHLSTIAVHARAAGPAIIPADAALEPFPELRDHYAWSKIGAERWVASYDRSGLIDPVVLRLGIVYGRERDFVARIWRSLGRAGLLVAGTPRMRLPLVHVDDVAEAVLRVLHLRRPVSTPLHVVGPDAPTQAAYLARRAVHRQHGGRAIYVPLTMAVALARRRAWRAALVPPRAPSRAYALAWCQQEARYDTDATERLLRWRPAIGIEAGLAAGAAPLLHSVAAAG